MRAVAFVIVAALLFASCQDAGTELPSGPAVLGVYPDSAAVGDTIKLTGAGFGSTQGSSFVTFGGVTATAVASWSSSRIIVAVPASATLSPGVQVHVGTQASVATTVRVLPLAEARVSFAAQVQPLLVSRGCTGCHGGTNNLFVGSYALLMSGSSNHGPVVDPYNGEGSVIIKKLRGTAGFGARMPQGGPYLPDSTITLIARWIKQGAGNN